MKKVILDIKPKDILLSSISKDKPIFACTDGKITGMLIEVEDVWYIRNIYGECADARTRRECIEKGQKQGYEFFTE